MRALRVVAVVGGLSLAWMSTARADTPRAAPTEGDVALEYRRGKAAATCPDEASFRERSADAFDFHDPFVPPGASAASHLRIEIAREGAVYRATLAIVDAKGDPVSSSAEEHPDCDALVWALGHRVALAILRKPTARSLSSSSSPPSPTALALSSEPPRVSPAPPQYILPPTCDDRCMDEVARRVRARLDPPMTFAVTVMVGSLLTVGWTADPGPGAWLGFEVRRRWFSLGLEARALFPARTLSFGDYTADAAAFSGLVVPCAHVKVLSGCAFIEAGSYIFTIPGRPAGVTDTVLSFGPRAALDAPIAGGFSVRGFVDLAFHPYSPIFGARLTTAADSKVVRWTTPLVSAFFGLGIGWAQ